MKKHYFLMCYGLLLVLATTAQTSSGLFNSAYLNSYQFSSPDKSLISGVQQPALQNNPLFEFDSLNVSYLGSWGLGQSFSIESSASGNTVFIGSGAGVIILDVTDPYSPVKISELSTRGLVDAIYFDESTDRLYTTAYFAGFEIWDLSNMSDPVKIGSGSTNGLPRGGIYADGNYVYVVTVANGVQIFDISNLFSPVNVGNCLLDPNSFAWNSAKSGNLIFAALSEGGLSIVDVTDPSNPVVAGTYSDIVYGVESVNDMVYVVSYSYGLNILDISDLGNISVTGTCAVPGFPNTVQIVGDYAFIGNTDYSGAGGVNVIDVSDPDNPVLVTSYTGFAEHLVANGNTLAYTGSNSACTILDISIPATPSLANTYTIPNFTGDIFANGNYAYTGNNGFRVFDITDKSNPIQVGYNSADGSIVRTSGDIALYIRESGSANNPVMVMDIADPVNPTLIGQYNSPNMTNDLEIRENYAIVSCWWDGIRVVDFHDPANPVLLSHALGWNSGGTPGVTYCYSQAIDIEGDFLYILDYGPFSEEDTKGIYILDISDISNPILVKRFTGSSSLGYDLDVVGDFIYIADNYGGVEVIDITDKSNPFSRAYCSLPDGANSIKVTENYAFVADYINGGVQVVNVSNPDNPIIAGYYIRSGCFALGVDIQGTNIFLADGAGGFQIYTTTLITGTNDDSSSPETVVYSYPNPFSEDLTIRVVASEDYNYCLDIYDAIGHIIATLSPVDYEHGETVYKWNGKTTSGAKTSPGIYYYNLNSGKVSGKIVKIK